MYNFILVLYFKQYFASSTIHKIDKFFIFLIYIQKEYFGLMFLTEFIEKGILLMRSGVQAILQFLKFFQCKNGIEILLVPFK